MSLANATKTHQLYFYTHQKRFEIQCVYIYIYIYNYIYVEYEIHIAKSTWKWIAFTPRCLTTHFWGWVDPSLLKSQVPSQINPGDPHGFLIQIDPNPLFLLVTFFGFLAKINAADIICVTQIRKIVFF